MRKNKISDILFGLLLFGFLVSNLAGCGSTPTPASAPAYTPSAARQTETDQGTREELTSQETEELQTEQEYGDETDSEGDITFSGELIDEEVPDAEVQETETGVETPDAYTAETDSEPETESKSEFIVGSDIESVKSVCGLVAPVETDIKACHWDSYGEHPYDVVYDYGEEYQAYVDACDWSLVFDADYYMDTFPMLALQYHYDEDELLFHFQTVGIHEGRQGSADFNVYCYAMNADLKPVFGADYEGYYLYYMLNYDTEKNVNTVTTENTEKIRTQYTFDATAMQRAEFQAVNADRAEVDVDYLTMNPEICALANYRAYINAHDGYKAHDWAKENLDAMNDYTRTIGATNVWSENTVTRLNHSAVGMVTEPRYYASESHYNAMVAPKYGYIGVSNMCNGKSDSSQFDIFLDTMN